MTKKKQGRKRGGRNRGYFFRKGRGWYATESGRMIPLRYEDGEHIKDARANEADVKEAHARWLLDRNVEQVSDEPEDAVTMLEVCQAYLANVKATGAVRTLRNRADTLFDFCFGLPPQFRNKTDDRTVPLTPQRKREAAKMRIHDGYGQLLFSDLKPLHVDQWLNAHPTWTAGGRRTRIQALKRAVNYCKERGLIDRNPIHGYSTPRSRGRVTYLTPEQEEACYENCKPEAGLAIRVCIRTGARFGCEFAAVTAKHVVDHGDRMEWVFKSDESKTGRLRIIRITDPDIIAAVRRQMERYPQGPLFRNSKGTPWIETNLSQRFRTMKRRLARKGIELDADACMYSCRHTYAKRILQGYWSGKPTNIETLARLMGNTPQVCRDHYLQWSMIDNDPLWDAA